MSPRILSLDCLARRAFRNFSSLIVFTYALRSRRGGWRALAIFTNRDQLFHKKMDELFSATEIGSSKSEDIAHPFSPSAPNEDVPADVGEHGAIPIAAIEEHATAQMEAPHHGGKVGRLAVLRIAVVLDGVVELVTLTETDT